LCSAAGEQNPASLRARRFQPYQLKSWIGPVLARPLQYLLGADQMNMMIINEIPSEITKKISIGMASTHNAFQTENL